MSFPSGPLFRGANVRGGKVFCLLIMEKGCGARTKSPYNALEVAEYDGIYYPATAEVVG